jgi:hypothetical protein
MSPQHGTKPFGHKCRFLILKTHFGGNGLSIVWQNPVERAGSQPQRTHVAHWIRTRFGSSSRPKYRHVTRSSYWVCEVQLGREHGAETAPKPVRFLSAPQVKAGPFCPAETNRERNTGTRVKTEDSANYRKKLEARVGIEPTYKGFADLSLTTWVPRLIAAQKKPRGCEAPPVKIWSGRRGSNPRHRPWQGRALPLSYSRLANLIINNRTTSQQ